MIRNICYELLDKTKSTTDIILRFEDKGITTEQYAFLKDRLNNFSLIIEVNTQLRLIQDMMNLKKYCS